MAADGAHGLHGVLHGGTPNPPGQKQFSSVDFPLCLSNLSKVLDPEKWQFFVLLRNATLTYPEEPSLKVEEDEEPFQKRAGALQSYHFLEKPT